MSGLSDLLKQLRSVHTPWLQRLRLAHYVWRAKDICIPKKHQLLLDWMTSQLTFVTRKGHGHESVDRETVHMLWSLYHNAVKSLDDHAVRGVHLKPAIVELATETINRCLQEQSMQLPSHMEIAMNVISLIIRNPTFHSQVTNRFESLASFVASLLSLGLQVINREHQDCGSVWPVLLQSMTKFVGLLKQQPNTRKVFLHTVKKLFVVLAQLRCAFQLHPAYTDIAELLCDIIDSALTVGIFHIDHLQSLSAAVDVFDKFKAERVASLAKETVLVEGVESGIPLGGKSVVPYCKALVSELQSLSEIDSMALFEVSPVLFRGLILSHKTNRPSPNHGLSFRFFSELYSICHAVADQTNRQKWYTALKQLVELIDEFDIYQVADDNRTGGFQLFFLQDLATDVTSNSRTADNGYLCLNALLKLNHHILDGCLSSIWSDWLQPQIKVDSLSCLGGMLVETYAKLKQMEGFVVSVIGCVKESSSDVHLPVTLSKRLSEMVQRLPLGQVCQIWRLLIEELKRRLSIEDRDKDVEPPRKRRKKSSNKKRDNQEVAFLAELLMLFMRNANLSSAGTELLTNLNHTVSEIYSDLLMPIAETMKTSDHQLRLLLWSWLCLYYSTVDVIRLYCDVERKDYRGYFDMSMVWNETVCCPVPSILSEVDWTGHSWQPKCLYLLKLISVQHMRQLLLVEHEKRDDVIIHQIVEFICVLSDNSQSEPWDGKVSGIDHPNSAVACWHLIASHLPILIPFLNDSQLLSLAQHVITSLPSDDIMTPGQMTMHTVTQLLVHSPVFFEIRRLHLYIVDCVFTGVASSLHQCLKCHCSKAAWKVGEKIWAQQVSSGMERQEIGLDRIDEFVSLAAASLTNKGARQKLREKLTLEWSELVEDVLKNGIGSCMNAKKREKVKSDEGNERSSDNKMVDHLSEQLEVLAVLPLHWLLPHEILRCFLGLIMSCVLLQMLELSGQSVCVRLLVKLVEGLDSSNGRLFRMCLTVAVPSLQPLSDWLIRHHKQTEDTLSLLRLLVAFCLQTSSLTPDISSLAQQAGNSLEEAMRMVNESDSSTAVNVGKQQVLVECILSACNKALQSRDVIVSGICSVVECLSVPVSNAVCLFVGDVSVESERTVWSSTLSACISSFVEFLRVCHTVKAKRKSTDSQTWKPDSEVIDAVKKTFDFALCHLESTKSSNCKQYNFDVINQCLRLIRLIFHQQLPWNDIVGIHTKFTRMWSILLNWHRKLCTNRTEDSLTVQSPLSDSAEYDQLLAVTENCIGTLLGASVIEEMESAMQHLHELTVQCSDCDDGCQMVLSIVRIWELALHMKHTDEKVKDVVVHLIPKAMGSFLAILQTSTVDCSEATLSVVRLFSEFLSRGKMVLSGASALTAFHACLLIPLSPASDSFRDLFHGVYNVVHMLLHHHLETAIAAVPVIIQCLKRMLRAILELARNACGQEDAVGDGASSLSSKKQLDSVYRSVQWQSTLQCAKLMSRLCEEIARIQAFSKYSPYIVAEYISLSQKWTPSLEVKDLLVPGVYKMLDLCGEHEMALLHATLDKTGKEIFQMLHEDYKKHYKYKGQV